MAKDTVQSVKKENDVLKAKLETLTSDFQALLARLDAAESRRSDGRQEKIEATKTLEFLSDEYDDLKQFQRAARQELDRLSNELSGLTKKVYEMSDAIDEFQKYSYQFNVKLVGVPATKPRESSMDTSALCVSLFNAMGLSVTLQDIDLAHRVSTRNAATGPLPIVCKFTRRLVKENVMAARSQLRQIDPASIHGLPEGSSLANANMFDHLTPKAHQLYADCKRFKERHNFAFCWVKNSVIFLRKSENSRPVKVTSAEQLQGLAE